MNPLGRQDVAKVSLAVSDETVTHGIPFDVTATITGICLGLDVFTPLKSLAAVLIFSGVWIVTISRARQPW